MAPHRVTGDDEWDTTEEVVVSTGSRGRSTNQGKDVTASNVRI